MMTPLLTLALLAAAADPPADRREPYRILQQSNRSLDPGLAASAYARDAVLTFEYPGMPVETFRGTEAIRSSYVRTFSQIDAGTPIEIQFRFEPPGLSGSDQKGAYRIDAKAGGRPITVYGRFAVKLIKEDGTWRFAEDRGSPATAADFDRLPPAAASGQ